MEPAASGSKINERETLDEILTSLRSPPGQQSGWAAIAQKTREYDEDKIKDVKEDMDSLFIFVGVFFVKYC
jgi:hypothetical protein